VKRLDTDDQTVTRRKIGIAEYAVVTDETVLVTSGLGSCLGIVLYDGRNSVSGLIHVMLPSVDLARDTTPAKFVDTGLPLLIDEMVKVGANANRLRAWIVGGSEMLQFNSDGESIGSRNIAMAEQLIEELGIRLVDSDVGGNHGRSLRFDPAEETVSIRTADDSTQTI
jgi:chemotaxis protein CheD